MNWLHLDKILKIKNGTLRRDSDVSEVVLPNGKEAYAILYFLKGTGGRQLAFRLTSRDRTFSHVNGADILNRRLRPIAGFEFKEQPDISKIEKFLNIAADKRESEIVSKNIIKKFKITSITGMFKKKLDESVVVEEASDNTMQALFTFIIMFGFFLYYWIRQAYHYNTAKQAETEAETDINRSLFKGQKENDAPFALYSKLSSFIKQTVDGPFPATIICGQPGTSKTYILRRTFHFMKLKPREDYSIEKGSALDMSDIYYLLYSNRDSILVLDDFDSPLKNDETVNFLKSITDSYKRRILSMPRMKMIGSGQNQQDEDVPRKFEFTGKLIIITNIEKKKLNSALLSRCPTIEVKFDQKEMIEAINNLYHYISPNVDDKIKKEVFNYILLLYKKNKKIELNFRTFQNSVSARTVNPEDWKDMVKIIVGYE